MQQPGPATKGNRVRQLRISCGSSPLTQPLISPSAAVQSPYLYLPGISVLAAVRRRGEREGWVGLLKQRGGELHASWTPCSLRVEDGRFVSRRVQ